MIRVLLILAVLGSLALLAAYGLARGAVRKRAQQRHMQELLDENRQLDEQMEQITRPSPIFGTDVRAGKRPPPR